MFSYVSIVVLTCFIINSSSDPVPSVENATKKVHIAIYYESLCPDSVNFLTNQLQKEYEQFKDHIDLLLVPFGKSESERNGEIFYCQHGPAECTGNRMQSCVLDALNDNQDAKVKFVTCQMKWNADYTGKQCANSVNVAYDVLSNCTSGQKGVELQLNAEKETHLIAKPFPAYVPTIVYNKIYNNGKQWRSLREFKRVLCDELTPIMSPADYSSKCS